MEEVFRACVFSKCYLLATVNYFFAKISRDIFVNDGRKNIPASKYMFEVNKISTRARCEICSKSTIKTPERRQWHCSGVFIVDFDHI